MVGSTLHNGLRVLEKLGSTREGPLYRAEFPNGPEVALMLLGPESPGPEPSADSGSLASPQQRFRQAARIRHLNVAAVHETGDIPDGPGYVVLECLAGELLSEILAERGALPPDQAMDLFLQTAAGLEAAHEAEVVHANLSPDTILVTRTAGGPLVKLIGFALASSLPPAVQKPTAREVGAEYASPERLAGHIPDKRSDVFSLGAVLHHLLVGVPPSFGSESLVPQPMRAAVAKALLPIPEHRFQTIAEFAGAVKQGATAVTGPRKVKTRRARLVYAGGIIPLVAGGLWLFASLQGRGSGSDGLAQELGTETGSAPLAAPAPSDDSMEVADDSIEIADAGSTPRDSSLRRRPRAAAAERALNGDRQIETARSRSVAGDAPPADSGAADTGATSIPSPPAASATLEERAQVPLRIGLDEASRHLGGPAHAIEGMSPLFIGLAGGRFPEGADTTRPLVRGVYLDPNGDLILLDQQRVPSESPAPTATGARWRIGDVMVYLHGDGRPAVLRNLASRVR